MKKDYSSKWKSSRQPRKQRKYRYNAPAHIRGKFLNATLSKDLRKKYGIRSIRVKTGDIVKVLRGQFKKKEGKVNKISINDSKVFIDGIEIIKKEGSKTFIGINASNVMITDLNKDDKRRMKRIEQAKAETPKKEEKKTEKKIVEKKTIEKPAVEEKAELKQEKKNQEKAEAKPVEREIKTDNKQIKK